MRTASILLVAFGVVGLTVAFIVYGISNSYVHLGEAPPVLGLHPQVLAGWLAGVSGITATLGILGLRLITAEQEGIGQMGQAQKVLQVLSFGRMGQARSQQHQRDTRPPKALRLRHALFFFVVIPAFGLGVAVASTWINAARETPTTGLAMQTYHLNPLAPPDASPAPDPIQTAGFKRVVLYTKTVDPDTAAIVVIYGEDSGGKISTLKRVNSINTSWTQWEGQAPETRLSVRVEEAPPGGLTTSTGVEVVVSLIP